MTYENYLGFSREVLLEKMRKKQTHKQINKDLGNEK